MAGDRSDKLNTSTASVPAELMPPYISHVTFVATTSNYTRQKLIESVAVPGDMWPFRIGGWGYRKTQDLDACLIYALQFCRDD